MMPVSVRQVLPTELEDLLPALSALLLDTVNAGIPLGFLPPVSRDQADEYWRSLLPELEQGSRVLLVAGSSKVLVASGQLAFAAAPNAWHRAEMQKLFVSTAMRGLGGGRLMVDALHTAAWERGRSLVVLHTRKGEPAEKFYRAMGYAEAGIIPGYTISSAGERYDNLVLWRELTA